MMNKVAIITDSTSTVPAELISELGIHVVPMILNLGGRSYLDGIDITPDEFYRLLRTSTKVPSTSAPSIGDFMRVYAQVGRDAAGIVSIHLAKSLSSTYTVALEASHLVNNQPIQVIDCGTASMAEGFAVLAAARKAASGASMEEVIGIANKVAKRGRLLVMLETLVYLKRGGRIGKAAWLLGSILQLKPILSVLDGQVKPFAQPRTRSNGIKIILKEMEKQVGKRPVHAAVVQADVRQEAEHLRRLVEERFNCTELYITEFTPVMGAHAGPGILGVAFYCDDDE
jgi:DegV family protein with EDD domain